jgi:hypothetical protein
MITAAAELIRAFEPILYFADGERFFPSDCKRYLERCALWNATPLYDPLSWHKGGASGAAPGPIIQRRKIGARKDELGTPGTRRTYLGEDQGGAFPFLQASGSDDRFLDLTGWKDGMDVPSPDGNRFANLDDLATVYNTPAAGDPGLKESRFWYHAEIFDGARLQRLIARNPDIPRVPPFVPQPLPSSKETVLLCYYLFFPGHDEALENCEPDGDLFGSYAGEWACISVLLTAAVVQVSIGGAALREEILPVAIGLTSRNVGEIGFLGGERRIGMRVHDWSSVKTVVRNPGQGKLPGIHPRIFVARGTHSLYLSEGKQPVPDFAPEDPSRRHCGRAELLNKTLDDLDEETARRHHHTWAGESPVVWTKALLFPLGLLWAGLEYSIARSARGMPLPGTRTPKQVDRPPDRDASDYFGLIIHPAEVDPLPPPVAPPSPGQPGPTKVTWPSSLDDEAKLETRIGGKLYSLRVDRVSADPLVRQVWWPGIEGRIGYSGRWGPRVATDPYLRRSGMTFPEFWEMFVAAFAKADSTDA